MVYGTEKIKTTRFVYFYVSRIFNILRLFYSALQKHKQMHKAIFDAIKKHILLMPKIEICILQTNKTICDLFDLILIF